MAFYVIFVQAMSYELWATNIFWSEFNFKDYGFV